MGTFMNSRCRRFALLASCAVVLAGCSGGSGGSGGGAYSGSGQNLAWNAPTNYRFENLTAKDAAKVEALLQSQKLLYRRTGESPLSYEVRGLRDPASVAALNRKLSDATGVPFETATMSFGGLDPAAAAFSNIEIKVTPGADAFVADGQAGAPWRRVFVDKAGAWKGLVNTKATVAKQGGWLYVAANKGGLTRYMRVNVGTKSSETLSYVRFKESSLPDPAKANVQTAETKSEGFKWPWDN